MKSTHGFNLVFIRIHMNCYLLKGNLCKNNLTFVKFKAWNATTVKLYVIKGQLEDKSETSSQYLGHENQPPNRGLRKRQATSSK